MGHALYPHPQWAALSRVWESLYPPRDLDEPTRALLGDIQNSMPEFVSLLVNHRPKALQGRSLKEVFEFEQVRPASLAERFASWQPMAADRDGC